MIEEALLTQADYEGYRDISSNIDFETRLKPWILEAQKQELRGFLGQELYLALINDYTPGSGFTEQRFIDLWEGKDEAGKYRYYGLKPVLIYFSYARFLKNQSQVVTRYGVKSLTRDESENYSPIGTRTKQGEAENMALSLQAEAEKFINDNKDDYPEYSFQRSQPNSKNIYHPVRPGRYYKL